MQVGAISEVSSLTTQPTTAAATPKNAEEAARQFEGLLIAQMLRSARESASDSQGEDGDSESSTMFDLSDQQFAQMLAQKGGLNLSRLILDGLKTPGGRVP